MATGKVRTVVSGQSSAMSWDRDGKVQSGWSRWLPIPCRPTPGCVSNFRCLITVIVTIAAVEMVVMLVLPYLLPPDTPVLLEALTDGFLLAGLSFIPLWLLLLGPLRRLAGAHRLRYGMLESQIQDGVFVVDTGGRITSANPTAIAWTSGHASALLGTRLERWIRPLAISVELETVHLHEARLVANDGSERDVEYSVSTLRYGRREERIYTVRDVSERKAAERELKRAHQALLESSRLAGMSEVATAVLHNVGNVLNSINTSLDLLDEANQNSKVAMVRRSAELLEEHADDLAEFLVSNKGAAFRRYLGELACHLEQERKSIDAELERLKGHVEHVKHIVQLQNVFAGSSGGSRRCCDIITILEDAIEINLPSIQRHGVAIERQYTDEPLALVADSHKILQIVVNLISNAVVATRKNPPENRCLWIRASRHEDEIIIEVEDNGEGIAKENLVRIFQHGFTTRENGHGFGLHSAAIAAQELGGTLGASSHGEGRGACFRLALPAAVEEPTSCSV